MHALTHTLLASLIARSDFATPTPTVSIDPDTVTPGFFGFAAIALLAIAVVFLLIDMLRRIRRAGYRADIAAELDAEEEAQAQAEAAERATDVDDEDIDPRR
ncbi:hypothetical protein [uncultured Microbacterium sp.]|uniref:hypothetical protein n=1 Tax=uncultured Microbacterium sp. TaxID=191216 RepID=UPI00262BE0BC|nr:hypothetical protein [uncultured Microbacterium sp.]